ncbi:MAG TPA: xanthine dehydrogenase family protein molybdopterin-binding subunit [candidate division Zixibacteria bacterium]|nr:xanthine dehydrogenase family protein molybdopterin-binding subunit [candidate division Zixibacteria bacterium]
MRKRSFQYVGRSVPRVDGVDKVTGRAKFLGDLVVPGMLHGKILRSPYPHARIRSIDTTQAEALPGVAAVLTAADLEGLDAVYNGRPVIATGKVRYVGEPVAAVAAADAETAEEAAGLIAVEYEELPAAIGIDAARAPGAPLIHEGKVDNICAHESVERGSVKEGFAQADEVFEDHFTFPMVYHYAMEPHAVVASWTEEGVTVWSSAQHPFQVRKDIAQVFRIPVERVRMVISYLGGGYGSKSYTKFEPLVVALARKAGAPVRVCNSVADSMVTVRRHAAKVRIKTGFKRDGTIVAREAEIYLDTGAYDDNGPQVTVRAATRVLGPYRIPNIRTDAYAIYTNSGSAGSFRAIGAPQVIFAGESQMDIAAARLGIDPAELRRKNLLRRGEELRPGLKGIDANLASGLRKLLGASQWKKSARKKNAPIGMACAVTNAGATPVSVALARAQADGTVEIVAGSTEMGQGVRTVLSQIAAEELTLSPDRIRISGADTRVTPYDSSTGSSRSTTCMGTAVQAAARDLKKQLIDIASETFRCPRNRVTVADGALISGEARLTFKEALERRFGRGSGGELIGRGYTSPSITDGKLPVFWEVGMGMVELELDVETGLIEIKRLVSVADVGKAIHPEGCIGQEEGAAMMGIGHTLFEQLVYDSSGQLVNSNLVDYRVPRFSDVPEEFHTVLVENEDGPGPFGVRGMGEGGLLSIAPAVSNALDRATGVRIRDLPLTPERVWRALRGTDKK